MAPQGATYIWLLITLLILCMCWPDPQQLRPMSIAAARASEFGRECRPLEFLKGKGHSCNRDDNAECCESGTSYPRFACSPAVSEHTRARLTLNDFGAGGDGGSQCKCDGRFHGDGERIVALSTGWFAGGGRCGRKVRIFKGGRSVKARVVDECDSVHGCDAEHGFQPPCHRNVVDASRAVWEALGISKEDPDFGFAEVFWTDAD